MSHTQLTPKSRFFIQKRLESGAKKSTIAKELGVHSSTIGRELKRNIEAGFKGIYNHLLANRLTAERRINAKAGIAFQQIKDTTETYIITKLSTHSSPTVISGELNLKQAVKVSKNTIYRYINKNRQSGGKLYLNLPHAGTPYRAKADASAVKIPNRVGIEHRPAIADFKTEPGHFEIDTVFGYKQESFWLTLVDKATKSTIIRKLANKKAETVVEAFRDIIKTTPYEFKTLTSDNGTEFTRHTQIAEITKADFFFANPYSSWERGLNEHTNGLP